MICIKCEKEIPEESIYCLYCGKKQVVSAPKHKPKHRGNGQGTVCKLPNGKYIARVTVGYDGHKRKTISKCFTKKSDAIAALPTLKLNSNTVSKNITFGKAFDAMIVRHERKASDQTIQGYEYTKDKYMSSLLYMPLSEVKTSHIQACIDSCDKSQRTKQLIRTVASLVLKYGMENDIVEKNYAEFVFCGHKDSKEYEPFTIDEIKQIYDAVGTVPYADYIICLIFTGFRPSEMFKLRKEDYHETYFIGGGKTKAGTDRVVPIPKLIRPIVENLLKSDSEFIFPASSGKQARLDNFRDRHYYPALEQIGVRRLSPYSCRHTYATLLKYIDVPDTDKQRAMGHAKFEMTAHYTHADMSGMDKIANDISDIIFIVQ